MEEITYVHVPPSLHPARPSILRSKSNSDISTTSSDSKTSSITFAPLPSVEARKRRNPHPIGLASRAEMLRRTRRQYGGALPQAQSYDEIQHTPTEDDEIPLPDIGKLVKGLWRSVSRAHGAKDKTPREARAVVTTTFTEGINTSAENEGDGEGGVWMEEVAWSPSHSSSPPLPKAALKEDVVKEVSRRDTICTIDSGSFLDELDGKEDIPAMPPFRESASSMDAETRDLRSTRKDTSRRLSLKTVTS